MHKVVVIDENAVTLEVYKRILRPIEDAEVIGFESSTKALAWCADNDPDFILIDYRMPEIDGLELIERYRKISKRNAVPIVLSTTSEDKEIRHRAFAHGADDFLQKPVDPLELLARVRNLLALRKHTKHQSDRETLLDYEVRRRTAALAEREAEMIYRLSTIAEFRDHAADTDRHVEHMGIYAKLVAEKLGMSPEMQGLLRLAVPMHDIGKVTLPDDIVLKPAQLTPDEWDMMKTHSQAGYDILRESASELLQLAAKIALTHHEKYDGSGYPNGLLGGSIPVCGRITAVVDVYDTLVSERAYKGAWPVQDAIDELKRGRGTHFDPDVLDAFLEILPDAEARRLN